MSVKINVDNGTAERFTIILSSRDHRHFGEIINVTELNFKKYLNSADELSFKVTKFADGQAERLWDEITDLKLVYVKEIDSYFEIKISLDEGNCNQKIITAQSACECELSQKYLYNVEINTEQDILRSDYSVTQFYHSSNHTASLLHRILSEVPAYTIKHVDASLCKIQRSFSINEKSIYDFLVDDCAKEFNCMFVFDSVDRSISVFDLYTVCNECGERGNFTDVCPECGSTNLKYFGEDTSILVTTENLTDEVQFETNIDNAKNCFTLEAGDDVMTAAVMSYIPSGGNKIYYISEDQQSDMPVDLSNKIKSYHLLYDSYIDRYHTVIEKIYECIERITYYTSKQMPEINIPNTSSSTEAAKLTASNLSPLSLSSLTSYTSLATINSALINYAKVYVRSGFVKIEVDSASFKYNGTSNGISSGVWTGKFKVTNYSNKEDICYSGNISVTVNDDYQSFINEKILKSIASEDNEDNSVYNVLKINGLNSFKNAIKQYCFNRLISFRDSINGVLSILMEANGGNKDSELYEPYYLKYYEKLQACNNEISTRKSEIEIWEKKKDNFESQKIEIQKTLDFEKYLGDELYKIFTTYIRESKYTNSNYVSDGLSDDKIFELAQEFIQAANEELVKSSYYQHSIRSNMYNLLLMDDFSPIVDHFEVGNWIRVKVDETIYFLRLISYEIDFDNLKTINTVFSDVTLSADGMNDVHSILKQASSMSSTYSYVSRQASDGKSADRTIEKIREEGLNSALYEIKNSDSEEITFGKNGLIAKSYDDISNSYSDEQLMITHNLLAYSTDGFKSVKSALGKMKLTIDGNTTYEYGLNSDFCISSKIIAGNIYSENYSSSHTKGTRFNLDDGTFTLADGKIVFDGDKLNLRDITIDWNTTNESENMWSSINANAQSITLEGQRAIEAENNLSAKFALTAQEIRAEVNDTKEGLQSQITANAGEIDLRVKKDGVIAAVNLSPETITLKANRIDLDGLVNATQLTTKFATISILNATTAELNNLISQKATIDQLNATNARVGNLEADHVSVNSLNAAEARIKNIEADYASVGQLDAKSAYLEELIADKASIEQLDAVNATIGDLNAKKIDATKVYADFMEVENWTKAGYINAEKINVDELTTKIFNASHIEGAASISCGWISTIGVSLENISFEGKSIKLEYISSIGKTVLCT